MEQEVSGCICKSWTFQIKTKNVHGGGLKTMVVKNGAMAENNHLIVEVITVFV